MVELLNQGGMLVKKKQGGFYDRFRDRIMFPIRNSQGQIIAFGGRSLGDEQPKYLNSPETSVFHKSTELYGLYEARQTNPQPHNFIVVEGYMDVLALAQYGFTNAVATLGTAVSRDHIQKLLRYTQELFFCFDGDSAGQKAAWRALEVSLPLLRDSLRLHFVFLPETDDPDTFLRREGAAALQLRLDQALGLTKFFFSELEKQAHPNNIEGRSHLAGLATTLLNKMPTGIFKQLMYEELAKKVQIDVQHLLNSSHQRPAPKPPTVVSPAKKGNKTIQLALSLLLQHTELAQKINDQDLCALEEDQNCRLFIELTRFLHKTPCMSMGSLFEYWRGHENAAYLAKLASIPHLLAKTAIDAEFLGAVAHLKSQCQEKCIQALLNKAKTSTLLQDEKQILQKLILQKKNMKLKPHPE